MTKGNCNMIYSAIFKSPTQARVSGEVIVEALLGSKGG